MSGNLKNNLIVAVDFDGTCTTHEYPNIGKDIGAVPVLKKLVEKGHRLMLWTMRGTKPQQERQTLQEAVEWFKANDIPLWVSISTQYKKLVVGQTVTNNTPIYISMMLHLGLL